MPRVRSIAQSCALVVLALAATLVHAQDAERLRVHGSATIGTRVMPAIVRAWLRDSGYVEIRERRLPRGMHEITAARDGMPLVVEIVGNGTARGLADLTAQTAELAMATRPPTAAEREAAWQLGDLDGAEQAFTVAVGGVRFVVDAASPVRALSVAQLREIYAGRVSSWSSLGGGALPVRAAWTRPRTASGELLQAAVMRGLPVQAERMPAHALLRGPGVIRALPLDVAVPTGMRAIAVSDGGVVVRPDRVGVLSEDYPLVRRYTLYGGPLMSALGRSLAMYAIGYRGQRAVAAAGALAVMLQPVRGPTPSTTADALVRGGTRLPVNLRFNPQGIDSLFDGRAARDIERLDALLRSPALRGRSLVVLAYVDRQRAGRLMAEQFANDRADYVAAVLLQRGLPVARARGLGEVAPLGAGADSRHRNERVELWLL